MGLLNKIFGNRDDPATVAGDDLAESTEKRNPVAPASSAAALAGSTVDELPPADELGWAVPDKVETHDPDEIDVSDQLDTVEGVDGSFDLVPYEDLIIEEEEDETATNISVLAPGPAVPDTALPDTALPDTALPDAASGGALDGAPGAPVTPALTAAAAALFAPAAAAAERKTLVAEGTELKGKLASSCPVVVSGLIDGEIDAPLLDIAECGVMLGSVRAKTLRSLGTLSGNVDAGEVFVSGIVRSRTLIKTRRLEMKMQSAGSGWLEVTFGACDIDTSGIDPSSIGSEPDPDAL